MTGEMKQLGFISSIYSGVMYEHNNMGEDKMYVFVMVDHNHKIHSLWKGGRQLPVEFVQHKGSDIKRRRLLEQYGYVKYRG